MTSHDLPVPPDPSDEGTIDSPTVPLAAGEADTGLSAGDDVGPYRLRFILGEGGMGMVWLADQSSPVRRRVALKVIKPGMDSRAVLQRFEAERQALAVMDHPGIATVLDAGTTRRGLSYFVMELVKGEPLDRFCDREELNVRDRIALMIQVCDAVQHAHAKGIVHRDLKPGNVLVTMQDGPARPVVIDFGVAKALDQRLTENTLVTEHGRVIGTPAYMSPEQAGSGSVDIDIRSDVYSLGVLLYQVLVGSLPFDRDRIRASAFTQVQRMIVEEIPPKPSSRLLSLMSKGEVDPAKTRSMSLSALRRALRGGLDWIVMRCLEKSRLRRYETAHALAMDLQRYLDDEPVLAGPPTLRYRSGRFVRRHRGPVTVAAMFVLLLIAATVSSLILLARVEAQRKRAEDARDMSHRLAVELVTEVNAALRDIPGTSTMRNDLILQGVAILEEIGSDSGSWTPRLARDIAVGYRGIGEALLDEGNIKATEAHYLKAADALRAGLAIDATDETLLREQGVVLGSLARLDLRVEAYEAANIRLRDATAIFRRLIKRSPENLLYRRDLITNLANLAEPLVRRQVEPDRILSLMDEAMTQCRFVIELAPDDIDEIGRLASLHGHRGAARSMQGNTTAAIADFEICVRLMEEVHQALPASGLLTMNLITARQQLREALATLEPVGDPVTFERIRQLSLTNIREVDTLLRLDPENPEVAKTAIMERVNAAIGLIVLVAQNEARSEADRRQAWNESGPLVQEAAALWGVWGDQIEPIDSFVGSWLSQTIPALQEAVQEAPR